MARRLIVDTGVLIAIGRKSLATGTIQAEDDLVISSVTLTELLTGVELAREPQRAERQAFVDGLLDVLPVEPYDDAAARAHASLLAHVYRSGTPRGAHDLVTAATAKATSRILLTTDQSARFDELPGVNSIVVTINPSPR
ncbi:PIN domain-containing protein [Salinibacterium sp.]|uniref:PIN domain-containing protein n=1 Tax=Salinibacterium sp. TaxID=1915057 RepID=UPI00286B329D|nr:PIN domain-containing protein [Salinibacterium sp.]